MTMPLNEIHYLNDYALMSSDAYKPAWFRNEQLYNCDYYFPKQKNQNTLITKIKNYLSH